ncbi:hypothetical protein QIS74_13645 [Colletotrichum tabaci]|uniref:PD-(D/E)XK nuclease-like domain-containing protein n=1 Tax=Colletotrichum tabaci TaxID=1209068 RepID=A0AAV9SU15_9PEZI
MSDSSQEEGDAAAEDTTTPQPAKRLRQHVDDSNQTPTPRPNPFYAVTAAVASVPVPAAPVLFRSSVSASVSETSSVASSYYSQHSFATQSLSADAKDKKRRRQSSPRKQTRVMAMERAFVPVSFGSALDPPVALDALVNRILALQKGRSVISHTQRESVETEARGNRQFSWVEEQSFAPPPASRSSSIISAPSSRQLAVPSRDELGPTPSTQRVKRIWSDAEDCQTFQHIEGQWNCAVHYPVLQTALGHLDRIGFCNCTGAQIIPDFTRASKSAHHNKRVDFCVYVTDDPDLLEQRALATPYKSVNHTELSSLLHRPIVLSIETKLTGHDLTEAMNQISAWLVAQWDYLDYLINSVSPASTSTSETQGTASTRRSTAAEAGLAFLPGLVAQGHDWYFIAITRDEDGLTRQWSKILIGTTETTAGIYSLIAVLQTLARWVEDDFYPWYRRSILGVD